MRPKRSVLTLRGDWQESRVFKRHVIHAWAAAVYGGGFWERVEIPPLDEKATS